MSRHGSQSHCKTDQAHTPAPKPFAKTKLTHRSANSFYKLQSRPCVQLERPDSTPLPETQSDAKLLDTQIKPACRTNPQMQAKNIIIICQNRNHQSAASPKYQSHKDMLMVPHSRKSLLSPCKICWLLTKSPSNPDSTGEDAKKRAMAQTIQLFHIDPDKAGERATCDQTTLCRMRLKLRDISKNLQSFLANWAPAIPYHSLPASLVSHACIPASQKLSAVLITGDRSSIRQSISRLSYAVLKQLTIHSFHNSE